MHSRIISSTLMSLVLVHLKYGSAALDKKEKNVRSTESTIPASNCSSKPHEQETDQRPPNQVYVDDTARQFCVVTAYLEQTFMTEDYVEKNVKPYSMLYRLAEARYDHFVRRYPELFAFLKEKSKRGEYKATRIQINKYWMELYLTEQRFKWQLFVEWLTDDDYENEEELILGEFAKKLRKIVRANPQMKQIFVDGVIDEFELINQTAQQYLNHYDSEYRELKAVEACYEKMTTNVDQLTFDFFAQNAKPLSRFCNQMLKEVNFTNSAVEEEEDKGEDEDDEEEEDEDEDDAGGGGSSSDDEDEEDLPAFAGTQDPTPQVNIPESERVRQVEEYLLGTLRTLRNTIAALEEKKAKKNE